MKRRGPGFKQLLGMELLSEHGQTGLPLVEIMGDRRVLVEHHQGVVAYGNCEIGIRVRFGILQVCGSSLCLARMTDEQIIITGCIESVRLIKNREGNCHGRKDPM